MRTNKLLLVALTWAGLGLASASGQVKAVLVPPQPPQPAKEATKSPAAANDPAEPPMKVEVSFSGSDAPVMRAPVVRGAGKNPARPRAPKADKVEVASSARGTTLTLNTPGAWQGAANLAFKDGAPPMRFTMRLARMPGMDLQSLSLKSGSVTLQVGQVGTSATTKYFNGKGQVQETATGAAYTVKAERRANGDVDVHLQRGAGAALAKTMTVSWVGNTGRGNLGMIQGGGMGGVIIKD